MMDLVDGGTGSSGGSAGRRGWTALLALALCLAMVVVIAGCGSGSDDGGSAAPEASTGAAAAATAGDAQVLEAAFKGVVEQPPTSGPVAEKGKTIWFSNCLGFEGCARFGDGVKAAAKVLGWTIKEVDNEGTPSKSISNIRQAISAKADGVIDTLSDCPTIKAGLQAAKAAKIPVITYAGLDCDNPAFGGGEALYAAPFKLGKRKDALEYYRDQGAQDAAFIVARARQDGIEKPKILQVRNENQLFNKNRAEGFEAKVKEVCPGCTVKPLEFTTEQLGTGKGQAVFKGGMLRNPGMDALYYTNDAFLAPGLQAALEANKGKFKVVCCGDGGKQGIANVRRSGDLAGTYVANAAPVEMWGWGALDVMNRVLAGVPAAEIPGEAQVSFYVDSDHNLPPAGQAVKVPFDYQSAYAALWKDGKR
jgi:ribose transport system substrate-binding protein